MPRNVELEHNSAVPEHVHAITLVRHGRTAYNAQHRLQGQIDIPLDEVGQWQARQTADALRELYVDRRPDIPNRLVICSDLGRAAPDPTRTCTCSRMVHGFPKRCRRCWEWRMRMAISPTFCRCATLTGCGSFHWRSVPHCVGV